MATGTRRRAREAALKILYGMDLSGATAAQALTSYFDCFDLEADPGEEHPLSGEHPELVAERIGRFVGIVGADRVVAGSDCGFGTFAGFGAVDPEIAYAKLTTLAKGAALASGRL